MSQGFYIDAVEAYVVNILAAKPVPPLLDEAVTFIHEAMAAKMGGNAAIDLAKTKGINPAFLYAALQQLNPKLYSGESGKIVLHHILIRYGYTDESERER